MFTYYNLRRKKLSFSYAIPFNFTRDNDYYTGDSEYNLLKRRDYVLVRFLNGGDDYDCLQTIDLKIGNQHSLWQQLNNVNKFSHDILKRYDADFLVDFARNKLSIDPFKFLKNVPIFEIENMQLYVYMPPVDDFGNLQIGDDRIGYVDVTVEITIITVDMGSEDFEKCTKAIFAAIWSSDIETEHERIDDLGEVDEPCTIVTSIDEYSDGTTVYGYKDTPKSQVTRNSIPLMTEHNKELARRLYCGKVWTCDALKFAETYYEHRDN